MRTYEWVIEIVFVNCFLVLWFSFSILSIEQIGMPLRKTWQWIDSKTMQYSAKTPCSRVQRQPLFWLVLAKTSKKLSYKTAKNEAFDNYSVAKKL